MLLETGQVHLVHAASNGTMVKLPSSFRTLLFTKIGADKLNEFNFAIYFRR